jgi:predicted RNase H-like HicB family nuclease
MGRPNYRVVLSFDSERKVYIARVPELPHCTGEGSTRSEAILKVEEELDALLANMAERGTRPPVAIDERELAGELAVRVSKGLQRELHWQAQMEGVEVGQLISEMLSSGLEQRRQASRRPAQRGPNDIGPGQGPERPRSFNRDDRDDRGGPRRGPGPGQSGRLLEDRAHFIEYVRNLENEGRGGGHGHGGHGHGGHSHGGHGHGGHGHGGPGRPGEGRGFGPGRRGDRPHRDDRDNRRRGPEGGERQGGEAATGQAPLPRDPDT